MKNNTIIRAYKVKYDLVTTRGNLSTSTMVYGLSKRDALSRFNQFAIYAIFPVYDYNVTGLTLIEGEHFTDEYLKSKLESQTAYIRLMERRTSK